MLYERKYFSIEQGEKFRSKIFEFTVIENSKLYGDAFVDENNRTIIYNPEGMENDEFASFVFS